MLSLVAIRRIEIVRFIVVIISLVVNILNYEYKGLRSLHSNLIYIICEVSIHCTVNRTIHG